MNVLSAKKTLGKIKTNAFEKNGTPKKQCVIDGDTGLGDFGYKMDRSRNIST